MLTLLSVSLSGVRSLFKSCRSDTASVPKKPIGHRNKAACPAVTIVVTAQADAGRRPLA